MNLRNQVQLIGNCGNDPLVKVLENGSKLAKVSVATSDYYKDGEEFKEKTTWHNVIAWGKLAEVLEKKCKKGSEIILNGKIDNRTYEDKNGEKRMISEVIALELIVRPKAA